MTTNILPEKVTTLYPPTVVTTISGRYAVYSGGGNGGWFAVDENFTMKDAMDRWEKLQMKKEEPKDLSSAWKWEVPNSKGNGTYDVEFNKGGWNCSCVGFSFRRDCKHVQQIKKTI